MNLNFWQWLGVILLVGGLGFYIYENFVAEDSKRPEPTPTPATQPL